VNTAESTAKKEDVVVGGPIAGLESRGLVVDDRERLRIIHELSKHVYEDTPKRNFRLLRQIHHYSIVGGKTT
jgi:hypothetical protein